MKKKKIGIVTMINDCNMGNRLQNYAVQEVYRELGYKAVTLGRYGGVGGFRNDLGLRLYNELSLVRSGVKNLLRRRNPAYNYYKFNRHIKFTHHSTRYLRNGKADKKYDYFSAGGDQVWNPKLGYLDDVDLLRFSGKEKNLSFSASIGLDSLDGVCDKEHVRESFLNFAHISVREERAKEIIEEMTGRKDVEVFLDPTLFISKEKWQKIERGGTKHKKKYIFLFFLSEIDADAREKMYRFAEEGGYEVVEYSPACDALKPFVGPSEWLSLVHHASYVCTDSFHACALSLVYNTPFTIFHRNFDSVFKFSMYSRIETLINFFSLEGIEYDGTIQIPSIDFASVNRTIERERERTYGILKGWLQ